MIFINRQRNILAKRMMLFNRLFALAALVLLLLVSCHANGECTADGGEECANPEAIKDETVNVAELNTEIKDNSKDEAVVKDPNCPSRDHVIRCAGEYLDTNKNGKLERGELDSAINSLPWYGRGILQIIGSVDKMMKKCDMDGDGAISMDHDMEQNKDQCLATCFKRRAFKGAFFPDCE